MPSSKVLKSVAEVVKEAIKKADAEKAVGKTKEILESQTPPATTPRGGPLLPRSQGMYPPDVPQVDLPRQKGVDKARAEGKKPNYTERMQSLLDSPTVRKKVDKLIAKGQDLGMKEWYGTEPLRQAALDVISPQQYESLMAQLASASQRNPVDQQNLMGSYLYYLQQQGRLDPDALLLTNKLKEQGIEGIEAPLIELPEGYGSLAQSAIFNRGKQIAAGDIEGALPPEKKLGTFYRNLLGNLQPVTVDVNAVRGPVIEAGDPRWLASKLVEKDEAGKVKNVYFPRQMVEEGKMSVREAKERPGFWEAAPSGSEYAGFEDLWQRAARREGVRPAEAQALGWYGSGDVTALKTKPELYIENLERLLNRTADVTGKSPLEVLRQFLKGEEFLRKAEGGAVMMNQGGNPDVTDSGRIDLNAQYEMSKGGAVMMADGGGLKEEFNLRKMGMDPTRVRGGYERKPLSREEIQAMMLDVPAGIGVPFAEAGSYALRGKTDEAKESAAIEAALIGVPGAAVLAKPAYRAVKKGVQKAAPAVREAASGALESAMESGAIIDPRMQAIAYHGSPHRFEKFDASKIGTGEGAQSYGHGLYFAESPSVAKSYKTKLGGLKPANEEDISFDVSHFMGDDIGEHAAGRAEAIHHRGSSIEYVFEDGSVGILDNEGRFTPYGQPQGHLYTVDIPDESVARMLDWDKPFSEQPKSVQKALRALGIMQNQSPENEARALARKFMDEENLSEEIAIERAYKDINKRMSDALDSGDDAEYDRLADMDYAIRQWWDSGTIGKGQTGFDPTGGSLLQEYERLLAGQTNIAGQRNSEAAAKTLREAGIPGIKYLDATSRSAGEGTRNFVVFPGEEETVKILERKKRGGAVIMKSGGKIKSAADMFHAKGHQALMDFDNKTKKRKG